MVSTKEIVMNENEFEFEGIAYVSVESGGDCIGCSFKTNYDECCASSDLIPPCHHMDREDDMNVIFVEKQQ